MLPEEQLPEADNLPVQHLVATLKDTAASYKFYWFMAILDAVRYDEPSPISFHYLLSRMVALAWYPNNYFRLAFGRADQTARCVSLLKQETGISGNEKIAFICSEAMRLFSSRSESSAVRELRKLGRYVPFRFLRPWFSNDLAGLRDDHVNEKIRYLAAENFQRHDNLPLYRFAASGNAIELQPRWRGYIRRHIAVLQSFADWHLLQYVQKFNPNVPGLANKLFAPEKRDMKTAKEFWSLAGPTRCIYSGAEVVVASAELDHFLPWSFVAHDLLWNIIPVAPAANGAKSDSLPSLDRYFEPYASTQFAAMRKVGEIRSDKAKKLLEDYQILVTGQTGLDVLETDKQTFTGILERTIKPQYEIAANMGFQKNWVYGKEA